MFLDRFTDFSDKICALQVERKKADGVSCIVETHNCRCAFATLRQEQKKKKKG